MNGDGSRKGIFRSVRDLFFSAVNKEFLIFLSFLLLSGTFWLILTLNETYEREIVMYTRLENVPRSAVITSSTDDSLRVTVRDKGYMLLSYLYSGVLQPVSIVFSSFDKGNGKGVVTTSEMQKLIYKQLYKSSKIVSVKPERYEFTYNNGDHKKVPVKLNGSILAEESFYIARVKFTPEQVTVYATREKLDSIKYVPTEQVRLTNVNDTVEHQVSIARMLGVKCVPAKVKMSVYPDVLTEETLEVPIVAVNMPEGKILRTFPSKVKVLFVAGASNLRNIHPEHFKVVVDYNEIANQPSDKCTLYLKTVPHGVRNARTEVEQVDYVIENV
jgi:hypothetical protein